MMVRKIYPGTRIEPHYYYFGFFIMVQAAGDRQDYIEVNSTGCTISIMEFSMSHFALKSRNKTLFVGNWVVQRALLWLVQVRFPWLGPVVRH
jgi:hypothetical protein